MLRILLSLLALLLIPLNVAAQAVTHAPTATPATERVTYIHTDALGSPILGTDAQGNVVWQEDYQPYGERFLGVTPPSQRLYTGKYAETRSGLVDFGGRWYNPEIGRFYSVDPQGFDEANPHSFNRYAYANNNPYRFTDPDGEAGLDIVKLGPAAGASFGALVAYTQGQLTGDAALVDASVAGMNAMMGSNAEALVSLVTPPGTARVVMNAAGPTIGGGGTLDKLTASEVQRIQNAANRSRQEVAVVGSRVNPNKPLTANSDYDYVIDANHKTRSSLASSLPGSKSVSESIPNNQDIFKGKVNTNLPHVIFHPE